MKNGIIFVLSACLVSAMVLLLAGCSATIPMVINTGGHYHPFNFINEDVMIDGLDPELRDELCRRSDLECRWVLNEWETMITDLFDEEFDAIIAGMSVTDERERLIEKGY